MEAKALVEALSQENDREKRTELFHTLLKSQDDDTRFRYALNWRIPHSLFNMSCKFFDHTEIQNIDWYKIHKSKDLGRWNGNESKIIVL